MTSKVAKPKGVGRNGNLIPPKKGEVRNPKGKPKGTKHISHWIQKAMEDPDYEVLVLHPIEGVKKYQGMPIQAIIEVAIRKAANGDKQWADWLAIHGYGTKVNLEVTLNPVQEILKKFELGEGDVDAGEDSEA